MLAILPLIIRICFGPFSIPLVIFFYYLHRIVVSLMMTEVSFVVLMKALFVIDYERIIGNCALH